MNHETHTHGTETWSEVIDAARPGNKQVAHCADQEDADLIAHLVNTALSSPAQSDLTWFSGQRRLSLQFYSPMYGDDDDRSEEWRVNRESGPINDREWETVGRERPPHRPLLPPAPLSRTSVMAGELTDAQRILRIATPIADEYRTGAPQLMLAGPCP